MTTAVQIGEAAGDRADFRRCFKTGAPVFLHDDGIVAHSTHRNAPRAASPPPLSSPETGVTEGRQGYRWRPGAERGCRGLQDLLPCRAIAPTSRASTKGQAMAHNFAINDDVHHQLQGPQGRAVAKPRSCSTIITCLPIEADGRPRYRIKSKTENVERVVTEEQISRLY